MIPLWKVRRELVRLGQQLRAIPEAVWEPFAQRRHDAAFERGFKLIMGTVAPTGRVGLLLIWQPKGISESIISTCDHLNKSGYAPFVVSNATLSAEDKSKLLPHVWAVMERPNFGYDFGGYRDGLRQLDRMGVAPNRLVVLNDSIWYPLHENDETLARMEASSADLVGTVLRTRGDERFLESYFYSIPQETMRHPAFKKFWRELKLTSNKYKVIRRGERGFSAAMRAAGLRINGLFGQELFLSRVELAEESELRDILRYPATLNMADKVEAEQLVSYCGADFSAKARALIQRMLEKGMYYSTFPVGAVRLMNYPVLKKSQEPVSANWRIAYLNAVVDGLLPAPSQRIMREVSNCTYKSRINSWPSQTP